MGAAAYHFDGRRSDVCRVLAQVRLVAACDQLKGVCRFPRGRGLVVCLRIIDLFARDRAVGDLGKDLFGSGGGFFWRFFRTDNAS